MITNLCIKQTNKLSLTQMELSSKLYKNINQYKQLSATLWYLKKKCRWSGRSLKIFKIMWEKHGNRGVFSPICWLMLTKNLILNLFKISKSLACIWKIFHILIHRQADVSIFYFALENLVLCARILCWKIYFYYIL